jgi:catechol 2,3-dioxygenase-like lactoylglutathione lyase family enzyme
VHTAIPERLDHAAIYCSDIESSIAWYSRVLGLPVAYTGAVGAFFDVGDTIFGLRQSAGSADLAQQHLCFAVSDIEAAFAAISERDVKILDKGTITSGYIVGQQYFDIAGPDGEDIEFVQRSNIVINLNTLHPVE